jgi:hypothetical protein
MMRAFGTQLPRQAERSARFGVLGWRCSGESRSYSSACWYVQRLATMGSGC